MNGGFKFVVDLIKNFARPDFAKDKFGVRNQEDKIRAADEAINEINRKRRELEARLKLLEIQAAPRGKYDTRQP